MQAASRSHVGLVRKNNEDAVLLLPNLYAVADGMGGHAAGEIASSTAIAVLEQAFGKAATAASESVQEAADSADLQIVKSMQEIENAKQLLLQAFKEANESILQQANRQQYLEGMGTTLTAVQLLNSTTALCCHVGDSRLYRWRKGQLQQLTQDHTYVQQLLQEGKITAQEAHVHPQRHMLLQAVGVEEDFTPQCFSLDLQPQDKLLLCSDGLSDMVKDQELEQLLAGTDAEATAEQLLERALDNGGRDNVSLILVALDGEENLHG